MLFRSPRQLAGSYSALHLYVIKLQLDNISHTHQQVFNALRQSGIGVNVHYIPIHTQPYYQQFGFKTGDFPLAEAYYQTAISLPLFHGMSEAQQDAVIAALRAILVGSRVGGRE